MATVRGEKKELTPEDIIEQANQRIAQMEMEATRRIEEMMKQAEAKQAEADKILENAKMTAARLPISNRTFDKKISEAERMSQEERMKRQFGDCKRVSIVIPIDNEAKGRTMDVFVNGIPYSFIRGEVYDVVEPLSLIILGSVYKDSAFIAAQKNMV